MTDIPDIDIGAYSYQLPADRIAQYPAEERDMAKMLVYQHETIKVASFKDLPVYVPANAHLIYNQTKVIYARLFFRKATGAMIEIFCLEPVVPVPELQQAFDCSSPVIWKCLVGHSNQWRSGILSRDLNVNGIKGSLWAERIVRKEGHSLVKFSWEPGSLTFADILDHLGVIPLPPYMNRNADDVDKTRYQTIYAVDDGSVAAPTAGLHFTDDLLDRLESKGITRSGITLHVGAGTFKPINSTDIREHEMHTERVSVPRRTILALLRKKDSPCVAVGTTSLRTLESLYWHGVKLLVDRPQEPFLNLLQWDAYESGYIKKISLEESLEIVLKTMDKYNLDEMTGQTQLMIVPGYVFQVADVLITNFHLPRSTLLLLISAFIGDVWKDVYRHALDNEFRFLSYGDSCLFFRGK
jgi:S-adenosylmethionine:tRNA ribosyltransferase-isomerase